MMLRSGSTASTTSQSFLRAAAEYGVGMATGRSGRFARGSSLREVCD